MEEVLAKIGIKSVHLITGLIGGGIALIFGKVRPTMSEKIRAIAIVLLGAIATGYLTPLLIHWRPNFEQAEHGIAFVVGIFGMGILEGLMNMINRFIDDPIAILKELKDFLFRR